MFNTLSKNCTIQEVMWKNTIHPDRLLKMHFACPKMKPTIHTHTHNQNISHLLLFHGTMVRRMHLNVLLYVHCRLVFFQAANKTRINTNTWPLISSKLLMSLLWSKMSEYTYLKWYSISGCPHLYKPQYSSVQFSCHNDQYQVLREFWIKWLMIVTGIWDQSIWMSQCLQGWQTAAHSVKILYFQHFPLILEMK